MFCLFQIVALLSGLIRHEIMDFMFSNPTMLDDLDFLYKSDTARKLMFYYQDEECRVESVEKASKSKKGHRKSKEPKEAKDQIVTRKVLTVQDGTAHALTGLGIYFIRTSTKRTLG